MKLGEVVVRMFSFFTYFLIHLFLLTYSLLHELAPYLTPQDPEDFSIIEVNLEDGDELGLLVVVVVAVVVVVRGVVVGLGVV